VKKIIFILNKQLNFSLKNRKRKKIRNVKKIVLWHQAHILKFTSFDTRAMQRVIFSA